MQLLLSNLIYALKNGATPLHMAADENNAAVAELLIRSGAHVNVEDKVVITSLHYDDNLHTVAVRTI